MANTADPGYDPNFGPQAFPDNPSTTAFEEEPNLDIVLNTPPPPAEASLADKLIGEKSEVGQAFVRYVSGSGGRDDTQPATSHGQADIRDKEV